MQSTFSEAVELGLLDCQMRKYTVLATKESMRSNASPAEIRNCEVDYGLIELEMLIFKALSRSGNNEVFPILLSKYDELLGVSIDISGNLVVQGTATEDERATFCDGVQAQREYIKMLCDYGKNRR